MSDTSDIITVHLPVVAVQLVEQTREVNETLSEYLTRAVQREAMIRLNVLHSDVADPREHVTLKVKTVMSEHVPVSEQYKNLKREELRRQARDIGERFTFTERSNKPEVISSAIDAVSAQQVRDAVRNAIDTASTHSELLSLLMPIVYPLRETATYDSSEPMNVPDLGEHSCEVCGATCGEESCIGTGEVRGDCPYWQQIENESLELPGTDEARARRVAGALIEDGDEDD